MIQKRPEISNSIKLGCVVRMIVDSLLPHAEFGQNDHRKHASPFRANSIRNITFYFKPIFNALYMINTQTWQPGNFLTWVQVFITYYAFAIVFLWINYSGQSGPGRPRTHLIFEHYNQVLVWLNNKRHEVHTHQPVAFCDISDISGHGGPI